MGTQELLVFAIVTACSLYALWVLMPAAPRRAIARRLLRLPLGARLQAVFKRAASSTGGCDCSGCDAVADPQRPAKPQVVHFHPRRIP